MFLSVFFFRNSLQFKKVSLPLQPQTRNNGAIAQLVEQRTENPCVPGSIPGGTTFKKKRLCQNAGTTSFFIVYSPVIFSFAYATFFGSVQKNCGYVKFTLLVCII